MKVLFLTISISLFSILQAQESSSSSSEEGIERTYFVKAIVSDTESFGMKEPQELSPVTITLLNNGNLKGKFTINKHGKCKEIKIHLEKTSTPGLFSEDDGKFLVYAEETSVKDHWIILCEGEQHGQQRRRAKLMGPNLEENPKAFEEFKKFIILQGFKEAEISFPRLAETCILEYD